MPTGDDVPGLRNPLVADADGIVWWSYPIHVNYDSNGVHIVTCSLNGLGGIATAYFAAEDN